MKKQSYKKLFNVALTTTLAAGAVVAVAPQAEAAISFKDVKETNTHYENIMNLAERGVIRGYEDGTFRPGNSIKRGNAAHIIAEIIGLDTKNVTNPNFKDISTKNSNYGAIAALANAGIINGFEDGTYRANDMLTRGQMSKIIAKAFKLTATGETVPFTDVERSQYKEHIIALFENSVTTGVTSTFFDTKSFVTRGQLSSFVVRAEKAVKEEPTPTPTPNPEPGIPTPQPNPGTGTPSLTDNQQKYIGDLKVTLEEVAKDIPNVDIEVNSTAIKISTNTNISKNDLMGLKDDVVSSFLGLGTTAVLNSVEINGKSYSTKDQLEKETDIAKDLAVILNIGLGEAAEILDLDPAASIWTELKTGPYTGTIYLNFKENNLRVPVTITLAEKAQ
ncbi:S-layer homology domain-containing protein [Solibacillus silvestris]